MNNTFFLLRIINRDYRDCAIQSPDFFEGIFRVRVWNQARSAVRSTEGYRVVEDPTDACGGNPRMRKMLLLSGLF